MLFDYYGLYVCRKDVRYLSGRGSGCGITRGRGHNNQSDQAEEEFQGWKNYQDIPQDAFPNPNSIQNMQFTQHIPQTATFP